MKPVNLYTGENLEETQRKLVTLVDDIYNRFVRLQEQVINFDTGENLVKTIPFSTESDEVNTDLTAHLAAYDHTKIHTQNTDTQLDSGTVSIDGSDNTAIGDGGTTNYANFAADGELTLNGTARVTKIIETDSANLGKGATAPTQVIIGNYTAWEFTVGDDAVIDFSLPLSWASGTSLSLVIIWYINEAYATNSGEIQWEIDWSATPSDASEAIDSPTHSGTINSGDVNIPATAKYLTKTTVGTIAGASLSASDEIGLTVKRVAIDDGNNPAAADPAIVHIEISYTSDKLGTAT